MPNTSLISRLAALLPHFIILGFVLAVTFLLGKDLNWDQYNYHLYLPHAFLNDRLAIDVMPASTNSHLNPLPYLPFYWMAMSNWHSFAVSGALAAFHALSISLVWVLAKRVWFATDTNSTAYSALATAMAAITPVYLALIGATFLEASLCVLILAGLAAACFGMQADASRTRWWLLLSGLLFGGTMGFKLTGIVFAAGLGFALLICIAPRQWFRLVTFYVVGLITGYLLTNGWLLIALWEKFRNPVFPFFNGHFQSPDFLPVNLSHDRFRWNSLGELAALPFLMTLPFSWVYVEPMLPDIRPTLLAALCAALFVRWSMVRLGIRSRELSTSEQAFPAATLARGTHLTIWFAVASLPFWLLTSANARYGLPLMLLIGPLAVIAASRLFSRAAHAVGLVLIVIFWQLVQQAFAWPPRWDTTGWTPHWYQAEVPVRLSQEPFAYLSVGETHTNSFVVPFVHAKSAFTSIAGNTFTFDPDAPTSAPYRAFIAQNAGKLRTLYAVRTTSNRISTLDQRYLNDVLAPWRLRVNYNDCEFIRINLENPDAHSDLYDGPGPIDLSDRLQNKYDTRLAACAVVPGPGESEMVQAERARLSAVLDRVEASCPLLFGPSGWYLTREPEGWKRHYLRSDITVKVHRNLKLSLRRDLFGPFDVPMGTVQQWERGETPFRCERLQKHWQVRD